MSEFSEENILLAGQISNKFPVFQTIAQMDKDSALTYLLLEKINDINDKEPLDIIKEIVLLTGQVNFMAACSELSKLSAIMGDTRKRHSAKPLRDLLTRAKNSEDTTE